MTPVLQTGQKIKIERVIAGAPAVKTRNFLVSFEVTAKQNIEGRQFIFKCASSFPYQELWKKMLNNIQFISLYLKQEISSG